MLVAEILQLNLNEVIDLLTERADNNKCDGETCDEKPPYTGCEGCRASKALNEASEILRKAI